ncbi:copper amine oxidase domain protein [Paenibacillus mucilaginosus KNP414]|uniref:Copper amine oxidase domain protein n=1 Tax=Paenibacillus mucilaginosus (strain KNP414) TaxID=1036673 RepID=F8F5D9_PAEMK|nr:copper amine oxidase domain protein [Paenibacillus mucilaginosus KNP414]
MLKETIKRKLLIPLAVVFPVVLTACQPVDGVDMDSAFAKMAEVRTYHSSAKLSWELELGDFASSDIPMSEWNKSRIGVFSKGSLVITERTIGQESLSVKGELHLRDKIIPIELFKQPDYVAVQLGGANKIIKMDLKNSHFGYHDSYFWMGFMNGISAADKNDWGGSVGEVTKAALALLPNLQNIQTANKEAQIGGEKVPLTSVSFSLDDKRLGEYLIAVIESVLNNEKGVKEFLRLAYKAYQGEPITEEYLNETYENIQDELSRSKAFINRDSFATYTGATFEAQGSVGFDAAGDLRDGGLTLDVNWTESPSIQQAHIEYSEDYWDMNETLVPAQTPEREAFVEEDSDTLPEFMAQLDPQSDLYALLKEDFQADVIQEDYSLPHYRKAGASELATYEMIAGDVFIDENANTMIGARRFAEDFNLELKWDDVQKQVALSDGKTNVTYKLGSSMAAVNGAQMELPAPVQLAGDTTYVPIRSIAEAFGMKVEFHTAKYRHVVRITKSE